MADIKLSGFGDEIVEDFEGQLKNMSEMNLHAIELRGLWGTNVIDLSEDEKLKARELLERYEVEVSSIGSPIGKVSVEAPASEEMERFERAVDKALYFDAQYIRVFSFYPPEGEPLNVCRDAVMDRMQQMTDIARNADVTMVLENEKGLYGEQADRVADILNTIDAPQMKMAFDPANFVQVGQRPFDDCWPLLKEHVCYMHIKDAKLEDGTVVLTGEGDGQIPAILGALKEMGYQGFASLEPHLQVAGHSSGFTGPELFSKAADTLRSYLEQAGLTHE